MNTFSSKTKEKKKVSKNEANNPRHFLPPKSYSKFGGGFIQRKASCACGGGCPGCRQTQSTLPISHPGDASEIEADKMAEKVMRMTDHPSQTKPLPEKIAPLIQTKREGSSNNMISSELSSKITSSQGGGNNLDSGIKGFMQNRFGTDFSRIKIHTDSESAQMNRELGARAFTIGDDVYFNEGQYRPESESGKRLLAHELTHTIQQNSGVRQKIIQRDLFVEPTVADPARTTLTAAQIQAAINWNRIAFTAADEIAIIRDVVGVSPTPAVIDEDFVQKLAQYQASFGLTQDGRVDSRTAFRLANELQGEAAFSGLAADIGSTTEMALNPAQRRMRLRSRVANRLGSLAHQGFVGARDNPDGIVTVRTGVDYQTMCGTAHNCLNGIQLDYTGLNANNAHWLQFVSASAFTGTGSSRVYHTGSVASSGGNLAFSNNSTTTWAVDSASATDPYYEAGFTNTRTAGVSTSIFDQPQTWQSVAEAFASAQSPRPAIATIVLGFDSYLIVSDRAIYHVSWTITFNYNTSVSPVADVGGTYGVGISGAVSGLPSNLVTVLTSRYSTSPIR